jgi:two-component system, NtrC family, response regulator AtoC
LRSLRVRDILARASVSKKLEAPFPLRTRPRSYASREGDDTLVIVVSANTGVVVTPFPRSKQARLGRAADCDVVIDDESVSRHHVSIDARQPNAPLVVEDIGSTNGTLVSGRCLVRGQRSELAIGAPFAVGETTVYVLQASAAGPRARSQAGDTGRVVHDPAMQRIYALLDVIAPSPLSVLILGETGVGKEVFAEAIHQRSRRSERNFLKLNCAALPESILEAELFGYEKGAFTGATTAKPGLFEAANGGTVMLDEVGDMPLVTQAKLLRVLDTGEVLRLGSVKTTTVDVRFISATNVDLEARVEEGKFRSDLYFRLDGISVVLPPLRDRPGDVAPLARMFAARVAAHLERAAPRLGPPAIELLERHSWPGNVRELRNVIERATVLCAGAATIEPEHLASIAATATAPGKLKEDLSRLERERIIRTLDEAAGNQTRAAKLLGISRHALLDRLDRYGIARPRKR